MTRAELTAGKTLSSANDRHPGVRLQATVRGITETGEHRLWYVGRADKLADEEKGVAHAISEARAAGLSAIRIEMIDVATGRCRERMWPRDQVSTA